MRRFICLAVVIMLCVPGISYCLAAGSKLELEWDYLTPTASDRHLDTNSLHILDKISATKNRSVYRGLTITSVNGNIVPYQKTQTQGSSAVGLGPVYMVRNEKNISGKLNAAVDMSGAFILYNKEFPAGGEHYDFMWRVGPRLIYNISPNSSVNIGYMLMHVSNGLHSQTHNPSYNARGVSWGLVIRF